MASGPGASPASDRASSGASIGSIFVCDQVQAAASAWVSVALCCCPFQRPSTAVSCDERCPSYDSLCRIPSDFLLLNSAEVFFPHRMEDVLSSLTFSTLLSPLVTCSVTPARLISSPSDVKQAITSKSSLQYHITNHQALLAGVWQPVHFADAVRVWQSRRYANETGVGSSLESEHDQALELGRRTLLPLVLSNLQLNTWQREYQSDSQGRNRDDEVNRSSRTVTPEPGSDPTLFEALADYKDVRRFLAQYDRANSQKSSANAAL